MSSNTGTAQSFTSTSSSPSSFLDDGSGRVPWAGQYPNQHPGPECFWWQWADIYGSPNVQWCEETLCQLASQPANTWSNLAYIVFSIIMWIRLSSRSGGRSAGGKASKKGMIPLSIMKIYPWSNFFCGALSLLYHASNFYPTQILDFVGMYTVTGWLIRVNWLSGPGSNFGITRATTSGMWGFITLFTVLFSILCHVLYLMDVKFQFTVTMMIFIIIAQEMKIKGYEASYYSSSKGSSLSSSPPPGRKYFWLSLLFLIIASVFSFLDITRRLCNPKDHVIQGHAIWHCFSSIGLYFVFEHKMQRAQK